MKRLIQIVIVIALFLIIRRHFFTASSDFGKNGLLPINLTFVQGQAPQPQKPVLIELWATWCGPCRQSIPHLNQLYDRYHAQGLEVVGISDENEAAVKSFMTQVPMKYPVALDPEKKYLRELNVRGIPHAFLLDANGKVIWSGHPMGLDPAQIEKLLPHGSSSV